MKKKGPNKMEVKPVLALPEGLELIGLEQMDESLVITVASTKSAPCCPLCGVAARRMHSRYTRRVADLPCGGQPIHLFLQVRKWFCGEGACPRKIFVERLAPFIDPHGRVTRRLFQVVQVIGLATGGRLGVRVTDRIGIQTSRQTILRRIMALPTEPASQVIELGIDDFSFRRGRSFGTVLVNLQTRQIIDILASRKAEIAAEWMASHPEIRLVSRDRGTDYISAATIGAPQAIQCANRFHVLKNLGEALERCLARHLAAKRKAQALPTDEEQTSIEEIPRSARRSSKVEQKQKAYREERLARYEQVMALRDRGFSHQAIADRVGIGHSTVWRWIAAGTLPETRRGPYASRIDPYLPYLFERWDSGCHNMVRLHQELVQQGYRGSYDSVRDHITRRLPDGKKNGATSCQLSPVPPSSKLAAFLFLRRPEDLDEEEQEKLQELRHLSEEVDLAYDLVQQFAQMLRTRTGEQLESWLALALESHIPEFRNFVVGIERDKAAVKAGLTLPQSNGIVEGKVHKLKLIKRMGYGRAAFPLLRQRVLHAL